MMRAGLCIQFQKLKAQQALRRILASTAQHCGLHPEHVDGVGPDQFHVTQNGSRGTPYRVTQNGSRGIGGSKSNFHTEHP